MVQLCSLQRILGILALTVALAACQSNKKTEDKSAAGDGSGAPQIESTPMSFDPTGSDSGKIDGLITVNFDYDKSALSAESKKKIQQNANWLKAKGNVNIQIEGHCDSRGSIEYNLSLGERRAKAVKSYMVTLGIAANRISTISYGKEKPLSNGDNEAAFLKNRRANFVPLSQ